ncbi:hypothetical protein GGR53DRAFT_521308 [Hypoxylon sp. FL1150]|nr:hypothetical protein GGR53DRAFT_521308 [Hypoxylon sp. FL1150]
MATETEVITSWPSTSTSPWSQPPPLFGPSLPAGPAPPTGQAPSSSPVPETLPSMPPERDPLGLDSWAGQYYKTIPITYGVELQFFIPVIIGDKPDPHNSDGRTDDRFVRRFKAGEDSRPETVVNQVINDIVVALRIVSQVETWTYPGPPYPKRAVVEAMDQEAQSILRGGAYSQWVVEAAPALALRRDRFSDIYTWVAVKVKSSKRNSTIEGHFDPIAKVIFTLRWAFRLRLPSTTSLSVHVGELTRDIDSYETCPVWFRRFCTLWWFIETHIFLLSHWRRRRNGKCLPLTQHSVLKRMSDEELARELEKGHQGASFAHLYEQMHYIMPSAITKRERDEVEFIWRAKDAKTLCQKLLVHKVELVNMGFGNDFLAMNHVEGRGSLGFQGFCEGADAYSSRKNNDGETGTIEFRSMDGSLDPELIYHWVTLLIRLYDISRRGKTSDIMGIIARTQNSYGALPLMRDLGLHEQHAFFEAAMNSPDKGETMDNIILPRVVDNGMLPVPPWDQACHAS